MSQLPDATASLCGASEVEHDMDVQERRELILGYIAKTNRLQRKMAVIFGALVVVAIGVFIWSSTAGGFALFAVALTAMCSFWVTAAHNAAHRQKLDELARIAQNGGKPLQTAHRRWHA
jgi:predicted phage tail protein